ncbi:MAG TPA: Crp/Fnr family transcriptional regulator [Terriglobales bacterium]|nr:Crp/Fnr family transcriptional regulator [Terriglobales bacterium]
MTRLKSQATRGFVTSSVLPGERTGPEGKPIANRILLSLPDREFQAIRPGLKLKLLRHHTILHESNRRTENIYFPNDGLISLVIVTSNRKTAEAGVIGNEGVVGLEGLFGLKRSPLREVVQIEGMAHYASAVGLQELLLQFPGLLLQLSRFAVLNRMQISQTAACNRLHEVRERLARWLLMSQDRVQDGMIRMTHDFLATMLGTDRGSVTEAAGDLQNRGLIEYARGYVKIVNRKALESSSCECYALIREYNGEMGR